MTQVDNNRTEKYTDAEFWAIERDTLGHICWELDFHIIFMTDAQRSQLTDDDQAHAIIFEEELRMA